MSSVTMTAAVTALLVTLLQLSMVHSKDAEPVLSKLVAASDTHNNDSIIRRTILDIQGRPAEPTTSLESSRGQKDTRSSFAVLVQRLKLTAGQAMASLHVAMREEGSSEMQDGNGALDGGTQQNRGMGDEEGSSYSHDPAFAARKLLRLYRHQRRRLDYDRDHQGRSVTKGHNKRHTDTARTWTIRLGSRIDNAPRDLTIDMTVEKDRILQEHRTAIALWKRPSSS